jgi:hypothetical protein
MINKRGILWIVFFVISTMMTCQILVGQTDTKDISIPLELIENPNSIYWQKTKIAKKLKIRDLSKSTDSLIIRMWDADKVVEIIKNDSLQIFVYPIVYNSKNRLMTEQILIKSNSNILDKLVDLRVMDLPDYIDIPDYKLLGNGFTTCFEISTNKIYRFYRYYKPQNQKGIEEAVQASQIIEIIDKATNRKKTIDDFIKGLPYDIYTFKTIIISGAERSYIPSDIQYNHIRIDE